MALHQWGKGPRFGYHQVEVDGLPLEPRGRINLQSAFTASDDPANERTNVSISESTLPSSTVADRALVTDGAGIPSWGHVRNVQVAAGAGIAGTKIDPNFGSQGISTTGTLTVGASAASTGDIRLRNAGAIVGRGTDALDRTIAQVSPANRVELGQNGTAVRLYTGATVLADTTGPLAVGASVGPYASSGILRIPNNQGIKARSTAGDDVTLMHLDVNNTLVVGTGGTGGVQVDATGNLNLSTSNILWLQTQTPPLLSQIDDATASVTGDTLTIRAQSCTGASSTGGDLVLRPGSGTAASGALRLQAGDETDALVVNGSVLRAVDPIEVATGAGAVASGGDVRLRNSGTVQAALARGGGNIVVLSTDGSDNVYYGDENAQGSYLQSGASIDLRVGGTSKVRLDATTSRVANVLEVNAAAGAVATLGAVRLPNHTPGNVCFAKAGGGNVVGLAVDNANNVNVGDGTNASGAYLSAASSVNLRVGSTVRLKVDAAETVLSAPMLRFDQSVTSPVIRQQTDTAAAVVGDTLTLQSQDCTGSGSTGGSLVLRSGDGVAGDGDVRISSGTATSVVSFSGGEAVLGGTGAGPSRPSAAALDGSTSSALRVSGVSKLSASSLLVAAASPVAVNTDAGQTASTGDLRLRDGGNVTGRTAAGLDATLLEISDSTLNLGTVNISQIQTAAANLRFTSGVSAPQIFQNDTSSAAGQTLTIRAQSSSSPGEAGGTFHLRSGDGGSPSAPGDIKVSAGSTTSVLSFSGGEAVLGGTAAAESRPSTVALDGSTASSVRVNGSEVLGATSALLTARAPIRVTTHELVATSGTLQLPHMCSMRSRRSDNESNLDVIELNDADELLVGGPSSDANRVSNVRIGAADAIILGLGGSDHLQVQTVKTTFSTPSIMFASSVDTPILTQADDTSVGAIAENLLIRAQSTTQRNTKGGSLHLQPGQGADGTGTSEHGKVEIQDATGAAVATFDHQGIAFAHPVSDFSTTTWRMLLANETRTSTTTNQALQGFTFNLEAGNYQFRLHLMVKLPAANNGGFRLGGIMSSGADPTNVSRLWTLIHVATTSSSIRSYQHSVNMLGSFVHTGSVNELLWSKLEGSFTLTTAGTYSFAVAQRSSAAGATTFLAGSYAVINKCSS